MTMMLPFLRRHHGEDEAAELLRTHLVRQARRAHTLKELTAVIDNAIDALDSVRIAAAGADPDDTGRLPLTGPIHGQNLQMTELSCWHSGRDLTVAQAKRVTQQHRTCPDDPAICRVKAAAMTLLVAKGVLVRDSRRNPVLSPASA